MGAMDEVARLKAERRRELAEEEAAAARAAEEEERRLQLRLTDAMAAALAGERAAWLAEFRRGEATELRYGQREIAFTVPGHRQIFIRLVRVGLAQWRACDSANDEEVSRWCATDETGSGAGRDTLADALITAEIAGWTPPEPAPEPPLSAEVEEAAKKAWSAMVQHEHPLPPAVAIDMVQDDAPDRDTALAALLAESLRRLTETRPREWRGEMKAANDDLLYLLRERRWNEAERDRQTLSLTVELDRKNTEQGNSLAPAIDIELSVAWIRVCKRTIALCRELCPEVTS